MPRARESRYPILWELKALSKEADHFADEISYETALDAWFLSARETVLKISGCTTVKEVENVDYPSEISAVFKTQSRSNENVITEFSEKQKEHVHEGKHFASTTGKKEIAEVKQTTETKSSKNPESFTSSKNSSTLQSVYINQNINTELLNSDGKIKENKSEKVLSSAIKIDSQLSQESTPKIPYAYKKNALKNAIYNSQELMHTPVQNKTFNKALNITITLNSPCKSNHGSNITNEVNDHTVILSKSDSKRRKSTDKSSDDTHESEMQPITRSHSKRKSSERKTGSNKKRKIEVHNMSAVVSATKAAKRKYPISEKTAVTKTAVVSENKAKISAVIVPSMQVKQPPVLSKGRQILEEIKKKEEKASENRKKVLAERQMKAEETKKKREEKREKTIQKRLQMEKEKEEKRELELKKSPIKTTNKEVAKKPTMKTRVKELIELEKKSGVLTSSKQNEVMNGLKQNECQGDKLQQFQVPPKTPKSQKSFDNENYELTPIPDSSTYDFSEDEDDKHSGKPIPLWAQGVHLKSALIQQYYKPPDTDELFGAYIESPDLTEIFRVQKKCYKLRTSSAIWNSPPARSLKT